MASPGLQVYDLDAQKRPQHKADELVVRYHQTIVIEWATVKVATPLSKMTCINGTRCR